jgi:hypothetical protein
MENYDDAKPTNTPTKLIKIFYYIGFSLGILLGIYTAHHSWTCYGNLKYSIPVRIIFAFGAFLFGVFYIIINDVFLFNSLRCSRSRRNKIKS